MKKIIVLGIIGLVLLSGCNALQSKQNDSTPSVDAADAEQEKDDFKEALIPISTTEGFTYIHNKTGDVILPGPYSEASPFSDDLALVYTDDYHFIDDQENTVLEIDVDYIESFHDGLALFAIESDQEGTSLRYGYMNKQGEIVVNPTYYYATSFSEGKALGISLIAGEWSLDMIDSTGNAKKIEHANVGNITDLEPFSNGLGIVRPSKYATDYFVDQSGDIKMADQYDYLREMQNGLAPAMIHDEETGEQSWGYIGKNDAFVISPQYSDALPFDETVAFVEKDNVYGLIDQQGNWVVDPMYAYVNRFSEGLAAVNVDGYWGYIDPSGDFIIEPQFTHASNFENGVAEVSVGERVGVIDQTGTYIYGPGESQLIQDNHSNDY